MTSTPAVEIRGLHKSFGDHVVLAGADLTVAPGTVHALLGPNGAGKTTTVNILTTLVAPDAGTVAVLGHDVAREPRLVRACIGLTGQFAAVDDLLTARENLVLVGRLHHLPAAEVRRRSAELLERFGLADVADRRPSTFSGGMRRRLDLAMGLVGRPSILVLDEPTTGLDPRSRRSTWDVVRELVAEGVTVLLTTQYLEEADQLADHVSLLDGGRVVADGTPAELKRRVPGAHVRLTVADHAALDAARRAVGGEPDPDALTLDVPGSGDVAVLRTLLDRLDDAQVRVDDLTIRTPDLDDVFLALTGRPTPADPAEEALR
ncbi:ATP-binding cassette domain-containing protein [Phycicoccus sp. MAQZ13P-2]|uniref:ATP-binding cassette domain-containing protein n=1 Tax=Phycicoccus mangrovi TaxID=2840470 RepID=UPI001C00429F|nr:ATP-binding cassette domain-containing protein [Phycicoccus mangrovi]MBT9256194.1 ATP-binding cassette domain-containing protein [Phycicoccus mangrovi]MBT9273791.1 ATP-binding cassette domain-containing protein [Phycicoccus mangrovi]